MTGSTPTPTRTPGSGAPTKRASGMRGREWLRRPAAGIGVAALLAGALAILPLPETALPAAFAADDACTPGVIGRIPGPSTPLLQLEASPAVPGRTGAGVTIAIVDSGVDATRPQLRDALIGGVSFIADGERPDGYGDPNGHGTAIAGLIAARPAPGSGVVGLAPEASLLSVRVFRSTDEQAIKDGVGPDAIRIADGIRWATTNGAQIIAVAMSDDIDTPELRAAVSEAAAGGSLVVASAGNRATTQNVTDSIRYPAGYPEALSITAVNTLGLPTEDSIHGEHVQLAAPGQNVLTTATGAGDCRYAADAPSTSFATGYAAAAAALVAQAHPDETPAQWSYRLMATADRPSADRPDPLRGWGNVRPYDAIALHPGAETRGPASPFADNSGSTITVPGARLALRPSEHPKSEALMFAAIGGAVVLASVTIAGLGALLVRRKRQTPAA